MNKLNFLRIFLIFGLVISIGFALGGGDFPIEPIIEEPIIIDPAIWVLVPTYEVVYSEDVLVDDGSVFGGEWSPIEESVTLTGTYFGEEASIALVKSAIKDEEICFGYWALANNTQVRTFKIAFDLDKDGSFDEDDDWGRAFYSPDQHVYDPWDFFNPSTNTVTYLKDGTGGACTVMPYNPWDNGCGNGIPASSYKYERDEPFGIVGEFCVPYDEIGLSQGDNANLNAIFAVEYFDGEDYFWFTWPDNSDHPDTEVWGLLTSENDWAPPGWCDEDSDCDGNLICEGNVCAAECNVDVDCGAANLECVDLECVLKADACSNDEDCAGTESCVPAADYDKCVELSCTDYQNAVNHECVLQDGACEGDGVCAEGNVCVDNACTEPGCTVGGAIECCSNNDCEDHQYCNENVCILQPDACENDDDCAGENVCSNHECVEPGSESCSGTIEAGLEYNPNNNKLKAIVSGIDNCEEKIFTIRENNCAGDVICSFESGDEGGYCEFLAPTEEGLYIYSACADLDGDGAKEFDKIGYEVEEQGNGQPVDGCESTGCMPAEWSECVCEPGETVGTQTGTCTDNCEKELEYEQACACEVTEPSKQQLAAEEAIEDAEDAIEEAEDEGKDVSAAEQKLEQAQEAFDSGNYDLAKELAEEAEALSKKEDAPWWMDPQLWIIGALGIITIAVVYLIADKIFKKTNEPKKPKPPAKPVEPSGEEKV